MHYSRTYLSSLHSENLMVTVSYPLHVMCRVALWSFVMLLSFGAVAPDSSFIMEQPLVQCKARYMPKYCRFPKVTLSRMKSVRDFENCAPGTLSIQARNYYYGFSGFGVTYRRNLFAYQRMAIRPQMLRDVSDNSLSTTVLGQDIAIPIGLSPVAYSTLANPKGDKAAVRAAVKAGAVMVLSSASATSLEELASIAREAATVNNRPYTLWMQTYLYRDFQETLSIIRRAENAGYQAIVVTVDSPIIPFGACNGKSLPNDIKYPNLFNETFTREKVPPFVTFKDLRRVVTSTRLPVIPKGILTASDALTAASVGVAGVFVSNHGGRQLDDEQATIDVLPEIVKALQVSHPNVEVYVDGGVRSGYDVFKAISIGAKAVFIGRPKVWGLAIGAEAGVSKVLRILTTEFNETMLLAGYSNPRMISSDAVTHSFDPRELNIEVL